MKKTLIALSVALSVMAISATAPKAMAADQQLSPKLIYEIGGSSKIKRRKNRSVPVGGGLRWHNNLMCGNFDRSLSITNLLSGVTGQMEKLADDLLASVTGVISSWPMMEIARADPALYEFLQQGKLEASDIFNGSVASCREMSQRIIANDGDAVSEWVELSGYEDWMSSSSKEAVKDKDVVQVDEAVDNSKGDNGVSWVGGDKKGGKDQDPIELEKDTAMAGFNKLAGRDSKDKTSVEPNEKAPWFVEYWDTPEAAQEWISTVIGSTKLRTCQDCSRMETTSGKGVYAVIELEQSKVGKKIREMVASNTVTFTADELKAVSAPGFEVSQQVIEALRAENLYQDALIDRLSEEVAIASITEKLIAARRILIAGSREANVAQNPKAVELLQQRIKELGDEMELLQQDAALRGTTKQSVPVILLQRKSERESYRDTSQPEVIDGPVRRITGRGQ